MSGSGGGGGGVGSDDSSDCASLTKTTTLNSAIPKVVKTLKVGDRLLVRLDPSGSSRVEATTKGGELAGSITYSGVSKLRTCLEQKWQFVAFVKDVSGGDVTVEIRAQAH